MKTFNAILLIATFAISTGARGQNDSIHSSSSSIPLFGGDSPAWQHCATLTSDREARLNCFDRWATQQPAAASATAAASPSATSAATPAPPGSTPAPPAVSITITVPASHDCRSAQFSDLSRFWELEAGSDCGTLSIRGYRPISLSWIGSDSVNTQPA